MSVSQPTFVSRLLVITAAVLGSACTGQNAPPPAGDTRKTYTGSSACRDCHLDIYTRWQETLMANVLLDPQERPDAILGDFDTPNPLVTFRPEDVAFTYGSKWKQRYFTQRGDDLFVFPAQWDVQNREWRRYGARPGTEWWVEHYPEDQMQRPTGPLCDGCHSVNYDTSTKTVTEWNVGCEACHGPGETHVRDPIAETVVNPARLDHIRATDVCIQCHSQGVPHDNPIAGRYYDWPVGFTPGDRLDQVWELETPHLGEETFTHWPEGSAHKNRMQGNDYVQSQMYVKGVTCSSCHDVHGTDYDADLLAPGNEVCTSCHQPQLQAGPANSLEIHTQHAADSDGSSCVACHMPQIARTVGNVNVSSHTFKFISPLDTQRYGVPNPCTSCHTNETNEWALAELRTWPHVSSWRVAP